MSAYLRPVLDSTSDVNVPAANAAATVTYPAVAGAQHCLSGLAWSYAGGTPTGGNLQVQDGNGNVVFTMDITAAGPGQVYFRPAKKGTANTAMTITLAAGGAGVSGKLSVLGHWTE